MSGPPRLILGVPSGHLTAAGARSLGLEITGNLAVLGRIQTEPRHAGPGRAEPAQAEP